MPSAIDHVDLTGQNENEPPVANPFPSPMSEAAQGNPSLWHASSEVAIRLVNPTCLSTTAVSFTYQSFYHELILKLNTIIIDSENSGTTIERRVAEILEQAKNSFYEQCPSSLHFFTAWAFRAAYGFDATTTGGDVFQRLLSCTNPFPETGESLDLLLEISEAFGCNYTAIMIAFGLYPGYRPKSEMLKIMNRLGPLVDAVQPLPPMYLAENLLLQRMVHFATTVRTMRVVSGGNGTGIPRVVFPSPSEVAMAVQWCMEQLPGPDQLPLLASPPSAGRNGMQVASASGPNQQSGQGQQNPSQGTQQSQGNRPAESMQNDGSPSTPAHGHDAASPASSTAGSPAGASVFSSPASAPAVESCLSTPAQKRSAGEEGDRLDSKRQNVGPQSSLESGTDEQHLRVLPKFTLTSLPVAHCDELLDLVEKGQIICRRFQSVSQADHGNLNINHVNILYYLTKQHLAVVDKLQMLANASAARVGDVHSGLDTANSMQDGEGSQAQLLASLQPHLDCPEDELDVHGFYQKHQQLLKRAYDLRQTGVCFSYDANIAVYHAAFYSEQQHQKLGANLRHLADNQKRALILFRETHRPQNGETAREELAVANEDDEQSSSGQLTAAQVNQLIQHQAWLQEYMEEELHTGNLFENNQDMSDMEDLQSAQQEEDDDSEEEDRGRGENGGISGASCSSEDN